MIEIIGDFWKIKEQEKPDVICFTSNKIIKTQQKLVMGAGIAKQFRDKYQNLDSDIAQRILSGQHTNHIVMVRESKYTRTPSNTYISTFPTKNNYIHPSDIELIQTSAKTLLDIVNAVGFRKILLTKPGCGRGNLNWEDVKLIIEPILDNRFIIIDLS